MSASEFVRRRRRAQRGGRRQRRAGDDGFTVMEIMVASAILLLAMSAFLSTLSVLHRTSDYQTDRTRALDDLRITAGTFAKDARHSTGVEVATADTVVMETYVQGALSTVKWEVVGSGTNRNLRRTVGTGSRLFVIRLTSSSIFSYDSSDPSLVRLIQLHMETLPDVRNAPVVLATEVSLRNVHA